MLVIQCAEKKLGPNYSCLISAYEEDFLIWIAGLIWVAPSTTGLNDLGLSPPPRLHWLWSQSSERNLSAPAEDKVCTYRRMPASQALYVQLL